MKIITFCRKGEAVSDFEISNYVDKIFKSRQRIWKVSTVLIIDEIRARVKEGKLDLNKFQILVEDLDGIMSTFTIDKNGRSWSWKNSMEKFKDITLRLF